MEHNKTQESVQSQEQHERDSEQQQKPADKPPEQQRFVDPDKLVETLEAENAERHERERAEEATANEIEPYGAVPEKYAELAAQYHEDFVGMARDMGLPAGETQALLHFVTARALEDVGRDETAVLAQGEVPGPDLSNRNQCMTYINRRYGAMASEVVRQAQEGFKKLPRKTQEYLDRDSGTGELLTNSPAVIAALALWNAGFTRLSREGAMKEIGRLTAQKSLDNLSKDKLAMLRFLVSRGKSREANVPFRKLEKPGAKPAPVKGSIEARIKDLRTHPAYLDASHKSHKEVVAQVSELYAQLHGGGR